MWQAHLMSQSCFPVARLQPPKCCVLWHSKEPYGCQANCSPPGGAAHCNRALSTAVLGTSGKAAYGCCASALSQRHSVCRGGCLLGTINLLAAGQGPWGPGMC